MGPTTANRHPHNRNNQQRPDGRPSHAEILGAPVSNDIDILRLLINHIDYSGSQNRPNHAGNHQASTPQRREHPRHRLGKPADIQPQQPRHDRQPRQYHADKVASAHGAVRHLKRVDNIIHVGGGETQFLEREPLQQIILQNLDGIEREWDSGSGAARVHGVVIASQGTGAPGDGVGGVDVEQTELVSGGVKDGGETGV